MHFFLFNTIFGVGSVSLPLFFQSLVHMKLEVEYPVVTGAILHIQIHFEVSVSHQQPRRTRSRFVACTSSSTNQIHIFKFIQFFLKKILR